MDIHVVHDDLLRRLQIFAHLMVLEVFMVPTGMPVSFCLSTMSFALHQSVWVDALLYLFDHVSVFGLLARRAGWLALGGFGEVSSNRFLYIEYTSQIFELSIWSECLGHLSIVLEAGSHVRRRL
jgi:hypothetical protein